MEIRNQKKKLNNSIFTDEESFSFEHPKNTVLLEKKWIELEIKTQNESPIRHSIRIKSPCEEIEEKNFK
ncbi:unnamed protein product, partial [Brachionus calyciflorus]